MSKAEEHVYEYEGQRLKTCECGATIFFARHFTTGKWIPVKEATGECHFIDCPKAAEFRQRRGPKQDRNTHYRNQPKTRR